MVLKTLIGKSCDIYIDDIIKMGKTKEQHLQNIEDVFMLLYKANFKVSLEKSKFFRTEVNFLGHIVTGEGILPVLKKYPLLKKFLHLLNLRN